MRRLLFILTILATSATAFAQNTVQYWFDQQTSRNALGNATEISTAGLATGIHFAHFQITGSDGLLCPVKSQAFLVMNENMNHSSSYSSINYWFDNQTSRTTLSGTEISTAGLATGIHFAHFQITGSDGLLSPVKSQAFLVMNENMNHSSSYSSINYWFDKQTAKTAYTSGNIDCSALTNGIHTVHFQIVDASGKPCPVQTQFFVNLDFAAHKLYYWFDSSATRNLMDIDGTEINVSALANGHHTLHAMLADAKGKILSSEVQDADFTIICSDNEHIDADNNGICDVCDELIAYTRSGLTEGSMGTLCLPKGGTATGATIYSVAGKRVDSEGNPTSLVLEEVTTLVPGKPYIFYAESEELNVTYSGTDASVEALTANGLIGSFTDNTAVPEGSYLLYQNKLVKCGTGCMINANRAYLDMSQVIEYSGSSLAPLRTIYVDGNEALSINPVEWSNEDAQRFNLSGMRIPRSVKGIIIINGKKVIKK